MTTTEQARELAERLEAEYRADWRTRAGDVAPVDEAIAALRSLADQVERLTGERDEARSMFDKHVAWASDQDTALTKERDALREAALWLVERASHHGNYAAVDQDHIDGLRDALDAYGAALNAGGERG